eukprot:scaffold20934_cov116-Isochrysis_galbana.AAC.3
MAWVEAGFVLCPALIQTVVLHHHNVAHGHTGVRLLAQPIPHRQVDPHAAVGQLQRVLARKRLGARLGRRAEVVQRALANHAAGQGASQNLALRGTAGTAAGVGALRVGLLRHIPNPREARTLREARLFRGGARLFALQASSPFFQERRGPTTRDGRGAGVVVGRKPERGELGLVRVQLHVVIAMPE